MTHKIIWDRKRLSVLRLCVPDAFQSKKGNLLAPALEAGIHPDPNDPGQDASHREEEGRVKGIVPHSIQGE